MYTDALPSAELYEKSYMHRDRVTHIVVCPVTDYIVTGRCVASATRCLGDHRTVLQCWAG